MNIDDLPFEKDIFRDVDGYHYYWSAGSPGSMSADLLRKIADRLDELNKPWDAVVERELNK